MCMCLPMNGAGASEDTHDCGEVMKVELSRFCRFTSLRGVPRTIRPGSTCLRGIWIFAVMSLLTLSIHQTFTLVYDYLGYPKVTLIYEKTVPLLGLNFTVTVCDLNPLSSQADTHMLPGDLSLSKLENQFYKEVYNFTRCRNCGNCKSGTSKKCQIQRKQMLRIRQRAATEMGLFQDMEKHNAERYGHQPETFIMSCQIMGLGANDYIYKPCHERTAIRTVTTPEFLNCFSIDVFDYSEYMPGVGVNLVLFLDNPIGNITDDYLPNRKRGRQSRGILLEVHDTTDFPTLGKYAIAAPPGHKIHTKFEMDQRERLGDPFGTCVDTAFVEDYTIDGKRLKYSLEVCYQACQQLTISKLCLCKQPWQLGYILDGLEHLPYCATTKNGQRAFIERMKCVVGREESVYNSCRANCPAKCNHFMFKTSHSLSQWPTTGNIMDIYRIYLKNTIAEDILAQSLNMVKHEQPHSNGQNFSSHHEPTARGRGRRHHWSGSKGRYHRSIEDDYLDWEGDLDEDTIQRTSRKRRGATLDIQQVLGDFGAFRMLADNLIMVEALLKDDTYLVVSDAIKTPHMELISQIGGIMNLWSGLNVIILIEIFELFYRLVSHGLTNYQNRKRAREVQKQLGKTELKNANDSNNKVETRIDNNKQDRMLCSTDINQL